MQTILYLHIRRYRYNFLCFHFLSISYKTKTLQFSELKGFSFLFIRLLWSWWESNPRPNKETIRFLHAYSSLDFRATARPGPPTDALSPKNSSSNRSLEELFPIYLRRLVLRFGTTPLGRRLVPSPCKGIKPMIYCASIKQREHTCCCQLFS